VLFADGNDRGRIGLGGPAEVVVTGLEPGRRYRVKVEPRCVLSLVRANDGELTASPGGALRTSAKSGDCG